MSRLYIELHPGTTASHLSPEVENQDFVIRRAQEILAPYTVRWKSIEWFSVYRVGQRVASSFTSPTNDILIVGDAAHTHSPKAAQGMNVSMHDSFNLAWKLNLTVRGLAKPEVLQSYEKERRQIAQQLIDFDHEHADAFAAGDPAALAKNFDDNIRFISGVGAEYTENVLNLPILGASGGALKSGALMPPAKVTRFVDANPVDLQLDIPMLGQFRILFFVPDVHDSMPFLNRLSDFMESSTSVVGRATAAAEKSYTEEPKKEKADDEFQQLWRYENVSKLFTFGLITNMDKSKVETSQLPPVLRKSVWTFYIDDIMGCMDKYLGTVKSNEVVMVNIRPDGYVGSVARFANDSADTAKAWLDRYYGGFLDV
jgi:phenol 2-monooxygenase